MTQEQAFVARLAEATGMDPCDVRRVLFAMKVDMEDAIARGGSAYVYTMGYLRPFYGDGEVKGLYFHPRYNPDRDRRP